jgi:hypothetical protein
MFLTDPTLMQNIDHLVGGVKILGKLGMVAYACNPCIHEAEARRLRVPGQPGLQQQDPGGKERWGKSVFRKTVFAGGVGVAKTMRYRVTLFWVLV